MIDHERKLLFIHIARTGGTSIETALCGKDWWQIEPETKHMSASQMRHYYGKEIWNSYKKFTVIRNPWDRVVSMWVTKWWNNSVESNDSFEKFIVQLSPHPHEKYNSLTYGSIIDEEDIKILHFESLEQDFKALLQEHRLKPVPLPHVEKREREGFLTYYTPKTLDMVKEIYEGDLAEAYYTLPKLLK